MPQIPCPNPINCEGVDFPVSNLTAEAPDVAKCFRYAFSPSFAAVCEYELALCQQYSDVGLDVGILCDPFPLPPTNPPLPVIYSSNAQSCTVDCGDGTSETYTAVAGTFVALSQAEADALAHAFACIIAQMLCTGPMPTLYVNTAQSCTMPCPDGTTFTYTTPAAFFTALSQAEANLEAYQFACTVASLLCSGNPPIPIPGGGVPPGTQRALFSNVAQTCTSTCPDGTIFSYTVPGGTYINTSRDAANSGAFALACLLARRMRVCLSDLDAQVCLNDFFGVFMDATGLEEPITFSVVAGALPVGVSLDTDGFLQGTPLILGDYAFTIRATGDDGQFAQRAYTMSVVGIDNISLADANVGDTYLEVLTSTGFTNPSWSVSSGALPDGLTLNPATGIISGTPTVEGSFDFTITVSEA